MIKDNPKQKQEVLDTLIEECQNMYKKLKDHSNLVDIFELKFKMYCANCFKFSEFLETKAEKMNNCKLDLIAILELAYEFYSNHGK